MSENNGTKLSIIIPVSDINNRIEMIKEWIYKVPHDIQLVLVHDRPDETINTSLFRNLVTVHENTIFTEGAFNSPGMTRNAGLKIAKAPFIAFWDSDDLPILSNVLKMLDVIETSDYDILVGGYNKKDASSNKIKVILPHQHEWVTEVAAEPGIWRMIFRSSVLRDLKFTNLQLGEDQIFFLSVLARTPMIGIYSEVVYEYLYNSNSQLTSKKNFQINNLEILLQSYNWRKSIPIHPYVTLCRLMHLRLLFSYFIKVSPLWNPKKLHLIVSHLETLICYEKIRAGEIIKLISVLMKSRG